MGQLGRFWYQKCVCVQVQFCNFEVYVVNLYLFVFMWGCMGCNIWQFSLDVWWVMELFIVSCLQVCKKNLLKDCVVVVGFFGVIYFLILSKIEISVYFKLMCFLGGFILIFQVKKYLLVCDVVFLLCWYCMYEQQFVYLFFLVFNSFGFYGMYVKFMVIMFQNLFFFINVYKVNLNIIKCCLFIDYNFDFQELDFCYYSIKVVFVGVSCGMKKFFQEKFFNMSCLQDISELLVMGVGLLESEVEFDGDYNIIELFQVVVGCGNM